MVKLLAIDKPVTGLMSSIDCTSIKSLLVQHSLVPLESMALSCSGDLVHSVEL